MWKLFVFVAIIPWAASQNGRDNHDHGHGWDIRLAVPGEPGSDYPTLGAIPRTSFSCAGREPGYYADYETSCQVFRICTIGATYGFQSFLCPNGTLFNQGVFVCDWWMNVKCEKSDTELINNGDRFSNLRLGPQLMKDIKKMLTHPMRNPYDLTSMRGNLIVMQDYKPPVGQLFPNEALLGGPGRIPNNVYVPAKQIQAPQNFNDNNDLVFAASTPEPRYLPAAFNTIQPSTQDAEFFQRQRQNGQYSQYNGVQNVQTQQRLNLNSNGHTGSVTQSTNLAYSNKLIASPPTQPTWPTQNYNQVNLQFGKKQKINSAPTLNTQSVVNTHRGQFNEQQSQYNNDNQKFSQLNNKKQSELGLARQQNIFNSNQEKQAYTYNAPSPQFINEISGKLEAKQNLALLFSLLADSINVAKEYSNLEKQDTTVSTTALNQYKDNEDVSPITQRISQLTSSQFGNSNLNSMNTITATKSTITENELTENISHNFIQQDYKPQQLQQPPTSPPQQAQIQRARFQNAVLDENTGYPYPINPQSVYSGQLYQLPVPVVTNQIYNKDSSAKLILPNNLQNTNSNENYKSNSNEVKSTRTVVENVRSDNQGNRNDINDFLRDDNGISAQIQDQISGTINHPSDSNKLINYKKDQTYYIYTKLNNVNENVLTSQSVQPHLPQNAKLIQTTNTPKVVAFQFIPSVSYQLDDEKDQQRILNAFQIDQFGSPKQKSGKLQDSVQGREILTSDINYTVDHTPPEQLKAQYNDISTLYNGPSSYSAPQASIGNLRLAQVNNYNSKLELEDNSIGYSRRVPTRQFNF
ncbi:putative uncharacterized protein DDB_G0282133 isoform X2 [Plodia interpunctella]|uniref:putative uncharacterized protein DDB_G0282133 isoform X2 n=1 Tax=Plodia interpunctella TaxID=58824 RepID=UPI0023684992|nr:putative uncharacterized protein DDB_G0282133 isoform X2 [Plodia interpunctella]